MSPGNQGVFQLLKEVNLRVSCHSSAVSVLSELVYFLASPGKDLLHVYGHEY